MLSCMGDPRNPYLGMCCWTHSSRHWVWTESITLSYYRFSRSNLNKNNLPDSPVDSERELNYGAEVETEYDCLCDFQDYLVKGGIHLPSAMLCSRCEEEYFKVFYMMQYDIQSGIAHCSRDNYTWLPTGVGNIPITEKEYAKMRFIEKQQYSEPKHKLKKKKISMKKTQNMIKRLYQSNRVCVQSGTASEEAVALSDAVNPSLEDHSTVVFSDANKGETTGMTAEFDSVSTIGDVEQVDLKKFLSRPALIKTINWLETDGKGKISLASILPWYEFLNKSQVKKKLDNYSFLRGNLKIKVVTNASPFLYGFLQIAYNPLHQFSTNFVYEDIYNGYFTNYSTRPSIWITPQSQTGGEMSLPFFFPKNYLDITTATDSQYMGRLDFLIYAPLQSANGVTTSGVTIQVYAWLEDLELAGPTTSLAIQSGECLWANYEIQSGEWGEGIISKPASAVASIARQLSDVPVIGRFAKATEIGASAVSSVASLFGFTNVPNLEEHVPVHPSPFPKLAVVDSGYPVTQLTLNAKNELSVDPRTVGLDGEDQLTITSLVTRPAWLSDFTWASTDAAQKNIYSCKVTPMMFNYASDTNEDYIQMTPLGWVSRMFSYWRGDIIFRVKLICSPFHKGRLKISFDPTGSATYNILNQTDTSNLVYTRIVDIGKDTDIEFRVPYTQALTWLRVSTDLSSAAVPYSTSATPTYSRSSEFDNGFFNIKVLTVLTGPTATATISGQVFVCAADNFELANPTTLPDLSQFAIQSAEVEMDMGHNTDVNPDKKYLVYHGEAIGSLRQLLRRSHYSNRYYVPTSNSSGITFVKTNLTRFPLYYGYDPNGVDTAKSIIATGDKPFNWVDNGYFQWIVPAFVGMKGSMIWHFNVTGNKSVASMRFSRRNGSAVAASNTVTTVATPTTTAIGAWRMYNDLSALTPGAAILDQRTNNGMSVVMPNYTNYKFQSTNPSNSSKPAAIGAASYDGSVYEGGRLELIVNQDAGDTIQGVTIHCFSGVGTDFSLFFFLNVPSFRKYKSTPTPL